MSYSRRSSYRLVLARSPGSAKVSGPTLAPWQIVRLRASSDARQTVYEIGQGLGCESLTLPTVGYQEYFDVESQGLASKDDERELKRRLKLILNELQTEGTLSLKRREIQRTISSSASCDLKKTDRRRFVSGATSGASPTLALAKGSGGTILHSSDISGLTSELQHHFAEFRDGQVELLTRVLVSGKLHGNDTVLRVHETRPSVWDTFGEDHALGHQHTMRHRNSDSTADDGGLRRRTQSGGTSPTLRHDETQSAPVSSTIANEIEIAEEKAAAATDHFDRVSEGEWNSLVRVFSYVHGVK